MGLFRMRESEGMELGGNASQAMLSQRGIDVNASFRGSMQLYVSSFSSLSHSNRAD